MPAVYIHKAQVRKARAMSKPTAVVRVLWGADIDADVDGGTSSAEDVSWVTLLLTYASLAVNL